MDTLESYLATDYLAQRQEIATIERMLGDVTATFSAATIFDGRQWPYEYRTDSKRDPSPNISQGTLAMVLVATGRLLGHCSLHNEKFSALDLPEKKNLQTNWDVGLKTLLQDLDSGKEAKVRSSTFGDNNPLTLSHISELYNLLERSKFKNQRENMALQIAGAKSQLEGLLLKPLYGELFKPKNEKERYYPNAFVPLRALRAASDLELEKPNPGHRRFFESSLHDQLSFSTIPDSRFDPAELLFCLEGLLLCAPEAVDATLFDRVLQVLAEKQNTSAHWRPNKPFVASSAGSIMLPVSVEGANSLMRSTHIMDRNRPYDTFTAKSLPLIQRFWHWLRARSVRFEVDKLKCVGWHSEHVNDPSLIHIWDTSQVTEFMISFKEMIERHIAGESLRLSRLDVKPIKVIKDEAGHGIPEKWKTRIEKYEPMIGTGSEVYRQIQTDFVEPWASGAPRYYSMLLFGPPGTGKTTVASNLAEVLGMRLITVTVSDFLGMGGANVEARAKAIFQTLEAQQKCLILFDEIDSFLLDRDTKLYREQDSLFQFLTPGMLTKINDLRKQERSLFIIATNYADRIDPAIKRAGRIDKQYHVRLPNAERRIRIMEEYGFVRPANVKKLAQKSALYGYPDLKGATKDAGGKNATPDEILSQLAKRPPATSLDSYLSRLSSDEKFPDAEFMGLVELLREVKEAKAIGLALSRTRNLKDKTEMVDRLVGRLALSGAEIGS